MAVTQVDYLVKFLFNINFWRNTQMASPALCNSKASTATEKAKLVAYNGEAPDIELMFNPTDISFARTVKWEK
jgi:hypothetical protein